MVTAEKTESEQLQLGEQESPQTKPVPSTNGRPVVIDPDLDFIRSLSRQSRESYKKCFQCGTCSATCPISPDTNPFPRKEMAWALWGMRDRLLEDPDVWLCHHCNDCSVRCPRSGRPGDVLAAVRRECVIHYAAPRFLARWVSQPRFVPLLLGLPAVLLGLAIVLRDPIANALGLAAPLGESIVYSYSPWLPHWLINGFFGLFTLFALAAAIVGLVRFIRVIKAPGVWGATGPPTRSFMSSAWTAIKQIFTHDKFTSCTAEHSRPLSHLLVFFGFIALSVVTFWVITGRVNPLLRDAFVYPFSFLSPWKLLANIGGAAVFVGCVMMLRQRLRNRDNAGGSTYFDWAFVWTLFAVVVSGFATEALHYLRMAPHRHVVYFIHLVFVFTLLIYLPYSKFAHLLYRTTAMIYAQYYGRNGATSTAVARDGRVDEESHDQASTSGGALP
ncbi:MAG: quinone-interacting membrane-bound oxidoreductase complex subunit QmoC [Gemmatimonadota bacterium]|nr:MAG: quinone-interacting membrane-bound oxidoreductase complex subunit QmoC [Gemmatimonadota bacterium]